MAISMLNAYRWVLEELDKHESPSHPPASFVYWFNTTLDEYLSNLLPTSDITQKGGDDLDSFVVFSASLTQDESDAELFELPGNFRHVWAAEVVAKWLVDYDKFEQDDTVTLHPKRRRSNRGGFQESNAYQRPSMYYPTYKVINSAGTRYLQILLGNKLEPVSCNLDYVKVIDELELSDDLATTNDELPFPRYVAKEMVNLHVRKVLENYESQRYSSQLQEMSLRK